MTASESRQTPDEPGGPAASTAVVERLATPHADAEQRPAADVSTQRVRLSYDAMACGVVVFSPSGAIVEANAAAQEILGRPLDELRRRRTQGATSPVLRADGTVLPAGEQPWLVALRTRLPQRQIVVGVTRADGQRRWLQVDAVPVLDAGEPVQIVSSFIDVTTRVQAEEALQANEERLHTLIRNAPLVLSELDADGVFTFSSGRGLDAMGLPQHASVGRSAFELYRDQPAIVEGLRRVLAGEESVVTVTLRGIPFEAHYIPKHDAAGRVTGVIAVAVDVSARVRAEEERDRIVALSQDLCVAGTDGYFKRLNAIARDVTERKATEAALRAREERFRALTEHGSDLVSILAPSGAVLYDSPSHTRVLGAPLAEVQRRAGGPIAAIHPDDWEQVQAAFAACTAGAASPVAIICRHRHADGSWRTLECVVTNGLDNPAIGGFVLTSRDVTERKAAEEALRQSDDRFRLIFSEAPTGMALAAPDGRLLEVNQALCQMLGYTEHELLEQGVPVLTHPDDLAESRELMRRMLAGEMQTATLQKRYLHRDGYAVWSQYTATVVRDATGQPLYFIYHLQDITARKQAEEALCASEERFRAMLTYAPVGAAVADEGGVFEFVNETYATFYGYTPAEMAGQPITMLVEPERRAALAAAYADYVARGATVSDEYAVVTHSGQRRTVLGQSVQYAGPDGRPRRATFSVDITARKEAEEALRASEERYRQVEAHAPIGLALVAPDGRWLRVNPALCALVGYAENELLERTFQDITHPGDLDADLGYVQQMLAGEIATYQMEKRYVRKDGTLVWVLLSVSLVRDEAAQPLYFISQIKDITARKRAEGALAAANRELERSNADLAQFASIAAHDLRSPLNTMGGYAQLLNMRYRGQLDAKADEFIGFIVEAVQRMQQLIDDLLSYARLDTKAVPSDPVDCATLVNRVVAGLQAGIEESGAAVTQRGLPTLPGHATQLGQLFQNLIANALKFRGTAPPQVMVCAERQGQEWLFTVQDNGIGIPADQLERIFVIFQRLHTRDEYEGTGIGLAVCKRIVERHGGRIWVESAVGVGTRFLFTLPVTRTT